MPPCSRGLTARGGPVFTAEGPDFRRSTTISPAGRIWENPVNTVNGSDVKVTEMRLVASATAGDRGARQELFTCHREAAYRVAYRITGRAEDALDVVQDSFIAAFAKLDRFQGESGFRTWLLRIVTNRALDFLRARKVRLAIPLDTVGDGAAPTPAARTAGRIDAPSAPAETRELGERLRQAVETLPAEQRAVFSLYATGEMTYGEIAEVLGIPIGTVMSRLYHARRRLREQVPDLAPPGTAEER